MQKDRKMRKSLFFILFILVLTTLFSKVYCVNSSTDKTTKFGSNLETGELWSRSNITLPAIQNLTIVPSNFSVVELSSQIDPIRSVIDVVKGFEPVERFNSGFRYALVRNASVGNYSLRSVDDELLLFLNASSEYAAAIAAYNLSFANPVQISETDFISFALSTDSTYNSSEAFIGISLLLRDQEDNRHYVSIEVSNHFPDDSFSLSKWFLGWGFTKEYPEYPRYAMRYNSAYGPWFMQLPLSDSFAALNLSSAWLDGLMIGGEIYSRPPFNLEEITDLNARFHYILVHERPFTINQEVVNSTMMVFPFSSYLHFSGIPGESVNIIVEGSLKPIYNQEERQENETVYVRETLFNLSGMLKGEISVQGTVKIAMFAKAVKKCMLTLNNKTKVDLTDSLLRSNTIVYRFPPNIILLKVHLISYRFNAWLFGFYSFQPSGLTKQGIVNESFSPRRNEGIININSTGTSTINLAIGSSNLVPTEIVVNGTKKPLKSVLILDEEMYWMMLNVIPLQKRGLYTVKYILSDEPLYQSLTTTPFSVFIGGNIFEIFTPLNIEGQESRLIPLTLRTYTPETHAIRIEYDPSIIMANRDEIMVYTSTFHFEYFMLKPLHTGETTIHLEIIDPIRRDILFSSALFVRIESSFSIQVISYYLLSVAALSLIYIFAKRSILRLIPRSRPDRS